MPIEGMENSTVVRTERGLTVRGTRLTLYQLMDYLVDNRSRGEILSHHPQITAAELEDVVSYIEAHRAEFEAEYQHVLQLAEEHRRYWEERNRGRIKLIDPDQLSPERRALWEKLQAQKERLAAHGQSAD